MKLALFACLVVLAGCAKPLDRLKDSEAVAADIDRVLADMKEANEDVLAAAVDYQTTIARMRNDLAVAEREFSNASESAKAEMQESYESINALRQSLSDLKGE